jgi:hypothetical protein
VPRFVNGSVLRLCDLKLHPQLAKPFDVLRALVLFLWAPATIPRQPIQRAFLGGCERHGDSHHHDPPESEDEEDPLSDDELLSEDEEDDELLSLLPEEWLCDEMLSWDDDGDGHWSTAGEALLTDPPK